jgi:hypothetical protein
VHDTYDGEDEEEEDEGGEGDDGRTAPSRPAAGRNEEQDEEEPLGDADAPYDYTKDDIQQQLAQVAEKQARLSALLDIRSQKDKEAFYTKSLEQAAAELEREQQTGDSAMKYLLDRVGADKQTKTGALSVGRQMLGGHFGKTRAEKLAAQEFAKVMAAAAGRLGSDDGGARNPALIEDEMRRESRQRGGGGAEKRYAGKAGAPTLMSFDFAGGDGRRSKDSLTLDFSASRFGSSFFNSTFPGQGGVVRRPTDAPASLRRTAPRPATSGGGGGFSYGDTPVFRRPPAPQQRTQHSKVSGRSFDRPSPEAEDAMDLDEAPDASERQPAPTGSGRRGGGGGKQDPLLQKRLASLKALEKNQAFQPTQRIKFEKMMGELPKGYDRLGEQMRYAPVAGDDFGFTGMMAAFSKPRPHAPGETYENGFFHQVATNVLFPSLTLGVNPAYREDFVDSSKLYDDAAGSSYTGFVPRQIQSGGALMLGMEEDD